MPYHVWYHCKPCMIFFYRYIDMDKYNSPPPAYGPPPAAPPSYSQAVGGVPPSSPFTPGESCKQKCFFLFCVVS